RKWRRRQLKQLNLRPEMAAAFVDAAAGRVSALEPSAPTIAAAKAADFGAQPLENACVTTDSRAAGRKQRATQSEEGRDRGEQAGDGQRPRPEEAAPCDPPFGEPRANEGERDRSAQNGLPSLLSGASIVSTAARAAATASGSLPRTTIWLLNRPSLNDG